MKRILIVLIIGCSITVNAQDYLISFIGTGGSSEVSTVKVENLTQGTSLTMNGTDDLHLVGTVTEIKTVNSNRPDNIVFYPNPMTDYAKMQFYWPESSEALVSLYDFSGREMIHNQDFLIKGKHIYDI